MKEDFLVVLAPTGDCLAHLPLTRRVTALAARDADAMHDAFGDAVFFVEKGSAGIVVSAERSRTRSSLIPGQMLVVDGFRFLHIVVSEPVPEASGDLPLVRDLLDWVGRPMQGPQALVPALRDFLRLVVQGAGAQNGILAAADRRGFLVAEAYGLTLEDAQDVWSKMPASLVEEVLRTRARLILPEGLREKAAGKSTVFVRDIRSVVGFPVCAEEKVLAVFCLTFRNVVADLSVEVQQALEWGSDLLGLVMQRALLREELSLQKSVQVAGGARLMVGHSQALEETYKLLSRLAPFDVPVLVTGETGTGKELTARELHLRSQRASAPFVAVNAAAIPETLFESELFGHRKGAFTGAIADRSGLVEQADGGTLFVDEIGEMPLSLQSKFLRVLQERSITRVGDSKPRAVNFRLVAATNRNLEEMVREKRFREDLYYRIAAAVIRLSPLRERRPDIVPLAKFFKDKFSERHGLPQKEFSAGALAALEAQTWPGNIRELENVVNRAFVMADGLVIRALDLGFAEADISESAEREPCGSLAEARDAWLRKHLLAALAKHGGNRQQTARSLGIGERTLFRYLADLGIREST